MTMGNGDDGADEAAEQEAAEAALADQQSGLVFIRPEDMYQHRGGTNQTPISVTGPLTDEEYQNLMIRPWESSLDAIVRSIVTPDRVSMQSLDALVRFLGQFRRWVPVKRHFRRKVGSGRWVQGEPEYETDENGHPKPALGEKGELKYDRLGKLLYEVKKYPEPQWEETDGWDWISPQKLKEFTLEELERLISEGEIKVERKWYLSPLHNERNVIGPREVFVKTSKRVLRRYIKALVRFQTRKPDYLVEDFYNGLRPEKWADRGQWPDPETPMLRLGNLNLYEMCKLAEYRMAPRYFTAERRWKRLLIERSYIIRAHFARTGKAITDRQLESGIEKAYQWWTPFSQHDYVRRWIPDQVRQGKGPSKSRTSTHSTSADYIPANPNADILRMPTAAERDDGFFAAVNQISWIVRYPVPTSEDEVDWSDALIYFPINEELRDLARMIGHFQQSKSQQWRYDKFNYSEGDINSALGADHGGAASGRKWGDDITFEIVYKYLESVKPTMSGSEWRKLRRELMGPVASRKPGGKMPANTAIYGEFGLRRFDITKGAQSCRGAISVAREGAGLRWDREVLTKILPGLRRYTRGEISLLEGETYFWYDPWDITKNNGGLKSEGMINAFINRLGVYTPERDGEPLIEIVDLMALYREYYKFGSAEVLEKITRIVNPKEHVPANEPVTIDWFNQTEIYKQLVFKQPAKNIIPHIQAFFEEQKRERVIHIRPKIVKEWLAGLPDTVLDDPDFRKAIQQLNLRSDKRIMYWAGFRNHGHGPFSARAVSPSFGDSFLGEGFATDNGLTDKLSADMALNIAILGWLSAQFDKALFLGRSITYNKTINVSALTQHDLVLKAIGGGLHPKIAFALVEAINENRLLKWEHFLQIDVPRELALYEDIFNSVEVHLLGEEVMDVVKRGGVYVAMLKA